MSRLVILTLCLLWPATVSAGEAKAQFNVGIVITGKRAASAPASNAASTEAPAAASTKAFAKATHQRSVKDCAARYRSYDPVAHTYIGRDGTVRRCP